MAVCGLWALAGAAAVVEEDKEEEEEEEVGEKSKAGDGGGGVEDAKTTRRTRSVRRQRATQGLSCLSARAVAGFAALGPDPRSAASLRNEAEMR